MKKLISIFFLLLYLVVTTELYQLIKIPELIGHYIEHKKLNPEMTVTAFVKTHYDHPLKDRDYNQDQRLPFIVHSVPLVLVFTLAQRLSIGLPQDIFILPVLHKIPSRDIDVCYEGFRSSAWQPPRLHGSLIAA